MIRERRVNVNGRQTRCLEAGAGWPLILLHAFPLNADMWRPQLEQVPDGWRFIAPDLRGFGPDARPTPGGSAPTMDDFADDVAGLMDALEMPEATIGGLSMGGYVAFALCRRAPERFTGIILADTRPHADTPAAREARREMIALAEKEGSAAVAERMLPKLVGQTTTDSRPEVIAVIRRMIESAPVAAITGALAAMLGRPDSTPELSAIGWPALVLVGAEDEITPPAHAEGMQRALTRSRLVVIPEAGHLSSLEAPAMFSAALADFLQSHI